MENLSFSVIRPGVKNVSAKAQIVATSSPNHFVMNAVAVDALQVKKGDRVILLHVQNDDPDARYYIAKAVDGEDGALLGEVGSSLHFNYAGIYGSIYLDDPKRAMVGFDELIEAGVYREVITKKGNKAKRGLNTVTYDLTSVGEHDINGYVREVFAFTNRKVKALSTEEQENVDQDATDIELED